MKYCMDWDGKTYLHFDQKEIYNSNIFSKKTFEEFSDFIKKNRYDINEKNLKWLKKAMVKGYAINQIYDNKGNKIDNTEIIKLARLCWNYISGETDDLSFLNDYKDKI